MLGYIQSYDSFATLDGDGIRFAVFMQGCNLRCVCCHNPETFETGIGQKVYSEDLVKKILRYKPYFKNGGGVTFSGGEPLLQTDFLIETSKLLKENSINIVLDTSISIFNDKVKSLYELTDLVIADLKYPDREMYLKYTRGDVFDTVLKTLDYLNSISKPVWVRTVIIPNLNDSKAMIERYYLLIKDYKNIKKYQLKPFHTMGFSKYDSLGIINPLKDVNDMGESKVNELQEYLKTISDIPF